MVIAPLTCSSLFGNKWHLTFAQFPFNVEFEDSGATRGRLIQYPVLNLCYGRMENQIQV